jgi:transcriptional regulator with XRE-family HTH domain
MPSREFDAAIRRAVVARHRAMAEELQKFRRDAGMSKAALARAAGVDAAYLGRIEDGDERPTLEVYERLAAVLGADLSTRLYPNTGPAIRDRLSAPMLEALIGLLDPRWRPFTEVAVRRPSRGWIDALLHDARARTLVATELQSELRRLEQLIRWHAEKADSLPSWSGWPSRGPEPEVSRLLIIRRTRATRAVAQEFAGQLSVAYPAHPDDALAALTTPTAPWPGAALLWAEVGPAKARLLAVR